LRCANSLHLDQSVTISPLMSTIGAGHFETTFSRTQQSRAERLARLDALATLLDTAFVLPGTKVRFGFDALIGLLPGIGDAITTLTSLYIVHEARQLGAPRHLIVRMLCNVLLDGIIGAVPLGGDAFDIFWQSNRRNLTLLRQYFSEQRNFERPAQR
jgi:hypothetical protein